MKSRAGPVDGRSVTPALARQARKLARVRRLIDRGWTKTAAAKAVGWTPQWVNRLLAAEREDELAKAS